MHGQHRCLLLAEYCVVINGNMYIIVATGVRQDSK